TDGEPRFGNSHAFERSDGGGNDAADTLRRYGLNRLPHALVQRRMRDPHIPEAQQHEHVVRIDAGLACHERGMSVEGDAGEGDRGLFWRWGDHSIAVARHGRPDRGATKLDGGAAGRRTDDTERNRVLLLAVEDIEPMPEPVGSACIRNDVHGRFEATEFRVMAQNGRIADQNWGANVPYRGVERSLQADLRADPGRVSGRDGDSGLVVRHGVVVPGRDL